MSFDRESAIDDDGSLRAFICHFTSQRVPPENLKDLEVDQMWRMHFAAEESLSQPLVFERVQKDVQNSRGINDDHALRAPLGGCRPETR